MSRPDSWGVPEERHKRWKTWDEFKQWWRENFSEEYRDREKLDDIETDSL